MGSSLFGSNEKGKAVQQCAKLKGSLCINALRSDTKKPLRDVKVKIKGKGSGQKATGEHGISEFTDLDPGNYHFSAELPKPKYKGWRLVQEGGTVEVTEGKTSHGDVLAYPTGTLKVRVVYDSGREGDKPVLNAEVTTSVTETLRANAAKGTHTFEGVRCGDYNVTASASQKLYQPSQGMHEKVNVPEGGTGEALIRLKPKTWIRVRVHNKDVSLDIPRAAATLKLSDGTQFKSVPSDDSLIEHAWERTGDACQLQRLEIPGDEVFEVVDVRSA
jgi:hypothetical protein